MAPKPIWPRRVKCPVVLSFDVDAELLWTIWLRSEPTSVDISQGVYGPKVGLPRILSMLRKHRLKATFFVPGWIAEKYHEEIAKIAEGGHEIAHHGYMHEDCSKLSLQDEKEMLVRGSDALKKVSGKNPTGFRLMPGPNTLRLLEDLGFTYDSIMMDSDLPYRIKVDQRDSRLIELPVTFAFNDTSYFVYTFGMSKPFLTPRQVERVYTDEFDALYKERGYCMYMLHPQLIGRPSRLAMLERTILHMKKKPGVWFATASEVADFCNGALPRSDAT